MTVNISNTWVKSFKLYRGWETETQTLMSHYLKY